MRNLWSPIRKNSNMITFSTEKTCNTLLAPMQHKDDISSYILYWVWLNSLSKTHKHEKNTYQSISIIGQCWAVKCQCGSKNHKDNSQKPSKYTESLTKISAPQLNIVIQPIRVKKDADLAWGSSLQYRQDTIQIESPLSLVNKRQRLTYVSHDDDDQNPVCSDIVNCR